MTTATTPPDPRSPDARVTTRIDDQPVLGSLVFGSERHGAELAFRGVVRGHEAGQPIRAIRYSAYLPMARATLQAIAISEAAAHPDALVHIHHRIGEVPAGEASLLLAVATPHSAEAVELVQILLRRLKSEIPIWKEPLA